MRKYLIILSLLAMVFATGCQKENVSVSGTQNGHDYVDLGLPSGTMWATCNVGANKPSDYGDYFAWGEVAPKAIYSESTYMYSGTSERLPLSADAAVVNWGEGWRMPSHQQFNELLTHCSNKITRKGVTFTGPNGNSIFLPAAGYCDEYELNYAGSFGSYWSYSLCTDYPYDARSFYFCLEYIGMFDSEDIGMWCPFRSYGLSVRPVYNP